MLKLSVYVRLLGLAAAVILAVVGVASLRTVGAPPAKAPVASRPPAALPGPVAVLGQTPAEIPAPDVETPAPAPPAVAAVPETRPSPPAPAAGRPPAQIGAEAAPDVPPAARAALVGRSSPGERPAAQTGRLDLNSASVIELNAMRGAGRIGRRIVAHRPYRSPEDLVRRRVITRTAYARIKDQVRVGRE